MVEGPLGPTIFLKQDGFLGRDRCTLGTHPCSKPFQTFEHFIGSSVKYVKTVAWISFKASSHFMLLLTLLSSSNWPNKVITGMLMNRSKVPKDPKACMFLHEECMKGIWWDYLQPRERHFSFLQEFSIPLSFLLLFSSPFPQALSPGLLQVCFTKNRAHQIMVWDCTGMILQKQVQVWQNGRHSSRIFTWTLF